MHSPCVMLFSAARNNLACLRRRLLTNKPAIAAAPRLNGKATINAPIGVAVSVRTAMLQDATQSAKTEMPMAKPAAPAMATSGQLRLSLGRFGAASIASGAKKRQQKTATPSDRSVVLALNATARFA